MKKITVASGIGPENPLTLKLIEDMTNRLKSSHGVDQVFFWPEIETSIDFDKIDLENFSRTPNKQELVIFFGIKE